MELKNGIKTFYAKNSLAWRNWLIKNHFTENSVWLIIYKKDSKTPSITYSEAVDQALCYGWIDSKPNKRDENSFYQFFSKRKPKSSWSKINKEKVKFLISENLMSESGLSAIKIAKENGSWDRLNEVDNLILPDDLTIAFKKNKLAYTYWNKFSKSVKQGILQWLLSAKRIETRRKRINDIVSLAEKNMKANQYVKK